MAEQHDASPRAALSRRRMLLAAGAAAALPGAGMLAVGAAGDEARAQAPRRRRDVPPTASLPLVGGPDFPIGVFWPPPPTHVTVERYQEIADAGFTFVHNGNYLWDRTGIRYGLDVARQAGLKVLVAGDPLLASLTADFWAEDDPTGYHPKITAGDAEVSLRALFGAYQDQPAFAGLTLADEPAANRFATLGSLTATARAVAPGSLPYLNLRRLGQPYGPWGTAPMDVPTYTRYLQEALDTIAPSVLSFDRYPMLSGGAEDPGYHQNWALVRAAGLRAGIPTWTFIQSLQYAGHRLPTPAELAWQVNTSLAYGAKGIQYFTYWTPDPSRGDGFAAAQGLVTVSGERTPLHAAAKQLNVGWLRPVGRELLPLVSESVSHANDVPLPAGATAFAPDTRIAGVGGDPVVLGVFAAPSPGDAETRWVLVANRSFSAAAAARLVVRPAYAAARFDPSTASYAPLDGGTVALALAPGAAALLRLTPR
ncbi:hypothetical protein [Streptomyces sp. NPDC020983]|uniref:hypothetical protein n=1 Tax=Streptomyces sp. NPDC020983 TaxID=3365106 RepID=UPI003796FCBB